MAAIAAENGVALRPHAKTHKMPEVARLQLAAGSPGITVAKLGEAEVMAAAGIRDIFIAYPIVGAAKLARLCDLAGENEIRVAADSWPVLEGMSQAAAARGMRIKVRLEVDSGFGRCGLQSEEEVLALVDRAAGLPGVEIVGLMGFGGHSYDAGGEAEIERVAQAEAAQLVDMLGALRERGIGEEISVGSTPTSPYAARVPGVSEIRPGTYVFSDRTQVQLGWGSLEDCALTVLSTVVSRPTAARAIVDVGTKGLTSDGAPVPGFGVVRDRPGLIVESLTEEHGIVSVADGEDPAIGERLRIIPNHACGALNMFDEVHVVRDGEVVDRWTVAARGRMR